jgi:urea transport system permease protein
MRQRQPLQLAGARGGGKRDLLPRLGMTQSSDLAKEEPMKSLCRLILLLSLVLVVVPARADVIDDILVRFCADKFPETETAINELVASNHPTSPAILEALGDNRLFCDPAAKTIHIKTAQGDLIDAKSGQKSPQADASGLKKIRINNALRRTIEASVGSMTLLAPERDVRLAAAEAVFKSRDAAALPALDRALQRETDATVKRVLFEARAALIATNNDAAEADRLAAIELIKARKDQDAVALLTNVAAMSSGKIASAADAARAGIQARLALWQNAQNIWYGLSLGSVLLLAAIGLAITFGVMGVINMAHGEMVMLGAYTTFAVQEWIRNHDPALFDLSLLFAAPLAFLVAAIAGMAIERLVIRFLYGRPLETLLATWGVSLILQQAVRSFFGANNREVGAPAWMAGSFDIGGLAITTGRMWIIVFTFAVFIALQLVLRVTRFGLNIRAVTQNRRMAAAMGIDTDRIDALAFALGSGIAGIAGVALSQIDNVSPNLGQTYIIDSFMVVVFGGVGNLWGTLVAALTLGVANKILEPTVGAVLSKILLLLFIILFIQRRPRGLFALKGRAIEA